MLLSAFAGALGGLITKTFDGPLNSIQDVWFATVGYKTALLRQRAEGQNKLQIEAYANDIANEVAKIPENSVKEPDYSILGPALEASTYYVNNETVRTMFAKLVASSVDQRKNGITRSAFVEFVKQMDPIDAQLLSYFSSNGQTPLGRINSEFSNNQGYDILFSYLLTVEIPIDSSFRKNIPSSIQNLTRLNLVESTYSEFIVGLDYEQFLKKTPEYKDIADKQARKKIPFKSVIAMYENNPNSVGIDQAGINNLKKLVDAHLEIKHGLIRMTDLGKDFVTICL